MRRCPAAAFIVVPASKEVKSAKSTARRSSSAETTEELQRLSNENAALKQAISNTDTFLDDSDEEDVDIDDGADYQVICPTCGEIMYLDYATIELGSVDCKNCGELLEFDLSDLEEEDI